MPSVSTNGDVAGGSTTGLTTNVFVNGKTVVCAGSLVASHGISPHAAATMTSTVTNVTMNGKVPCVAGNTATCGHAIVSASTVVILSG